MPVPGIISSMMAISNASNVNIAIETDTSFTIDHSKALGVGLANETDVSLRLGKGVDVNIATETDTAQMLQGQISLQDSQTADISSSSSFTISDVFIGTPSPDRFVLTAASTVRDAGTGNPVFYNATVGGFACWRFERISEAQSTMGLVLRYISDSDIAGDTADVFFDFTGGTTTRFAHVATYAGAGLVVLKGTDFNTTDGGSVTPGDGINIVYSLSEDNADDTTLTNIVNDLDDVNVGSGTFRDHQISLGHQNLTSTSPASGAADKIVGIAIDIYPDKSAQLLTNPSFDTGDKTGWTEDIGVWEVDTGEAGLVRFGDSSHQCGDANAAGLNEISQTVNKPSGYGAGDVVSLLCMMGRSFADAGEPINLTVEALDPSDNVLASDSTGDLSPSADIWFGHGVSLFMPAGTAKLRAQLQTTRNTGSFANGQFDVLYMACGRAYTPEGQAIETDSALSITVA